MPPAQPHAEPVHSIAALWVLASSQRPCRGPLLQRVSRGAGAADGDVGVGTGVS